MNDQIKKNILSPVQAFFLNITILIKYFRRELINTRMEKSSTHNILELENYVPASKAGTNVKSSKHSVIKFFESESE